MQRLLTGVFVILAHSIGLAAPPVLAKEPEGFVQPTPAERAAAVGDLKGISNTFRPYILPTAKTVPLPDLSETRNLWRELDWLVPVSTFARTWGLHRPFTS